jgi:hypothetical protein
MATKSRGTKTASTAKKTSKPRPRRTPHGAKAPQSSGALRAAKTHAKPGTPATEPASAGPPPKTTARATAPAATPPAAAAARKSAARAVAVAVKAPSAPAPEPAPAPETAVDRPTPPPLGPRRAVFIDVENTSSEAALSRLLDELGIDLTNAATEVTAIGNWRLASPQLGRSLARRGASLVHSAPAARVPDWSDLWIAVQAGIWLGRSRPGDVIEIVSHDRAFDAVGDAAARLGVTFRRLTYHAGGAGASATSGREADETRERRGRRRSRRGRGRGAESLRAASPARPAALGRPSAPPARTAPPSRGPAPAGLPARPPRAPAPAVPHAASAGGGTPHGASEAEIGQIIARLAGADPSRTVTLDALTAALKAAGFQRPPGSPRLVTRLRHMKSVEVLPNSRVRLTGDAAGAAPAGPPNVPPNGEWQR